MSLQLNICMPYRNMNKYLNLFLDTFIQENNNNNINLLIAEQNDDGHRFNLGKLTNIGYDLFRKSNYFDNITKTTEMIYMFHPVDFIPKKFQQYIDYIQKIPNNGILCLYDEINQPDLTFYKACMYTESSLLQTNGYPNNFWGWGSEDRCFLARVDYAQIQKKFIDFGPTLVRSQDPSPDKINNYEDPKSYKRCNMEDIFKDGISTLTYNIQDITSIAPNIKKILLDI